MKTCDYCRHDNSDQEHRCRRCGRRLDEGFVPAASRTSPVPQEEQVAVAVGERPPRARPLQRPLFSTHVVQLDDVDPSVRRRKRVTSSRKPGVRKKVPASQQSFDFQAPLMPEQPVTAMPPGRVEPVRYCEQPVAAPMRRIQAAAADVGIVAVALAAFLGIFRIGTGPISVAPATFVPVFLIFYALYKALWCLAGGDTPGTVWTGLRVMRFDGRPPTHTQRLQRLAAACMGIGALGLGHLWALGDQEQLTWHDHVSKTFVSRIGSE